MGGLYFQLASLVYILLLAGAYFSKKRISTVENKIYSSLIITNVVGVITDIASTSLALFDYDNPFLNIISKIYLIYLISFLSLLTNYALTVSNVNEGEEQRKILYRKNSRFFLVLFILSSIIILALPLYNFSEGNVVYTHGPSVTFTYIFAFACISVWIICMYKNRKKLLSKTLLPFLMIIVVGIIAGLIQSSIPEILLVTMVMVLVTFFMYFTIENPDVKMIEQLEIAKNEADRANNAKTDFLSNMSHEIRTPLNAIIGFSQGLLEEDLSEESKNEVQDIIGASNSLLEIVNGILDISKIEANKLEIVNKEYNFEKIFKELVNLSHGRLGEKPLDFRYQYDHSIPPVLYGDYVRVKQIVLNLLTNAIKYTREGYVSFNVSSVIKDDICRLIISVEDSGIGIKEENIEKLFSKFERFDLEKNITIEGTGLGLAITKKLVELMNGKIVVQSKYGEGSKFTIAIDQRIIPKTLEELGLSENNKEFTDIFVAPNAKILVVDDNAINIKVAQRLLKSFEIIPETVMSGHECINKILDGNKYDLILSDHMMPKMTGTDTLKNLKMIMGFETPVVALTANAISGMKEKYLEAGFNDYLSKPIDKNELETILRKFIEAEDIMEQELKDACNNIPQSDNIVSEVNVEELKDHDISILVNAGVDIDHSLELLGDMETINETFEAFLEESETRLPNIKNYKDVVDMPNYAILVHAMKSDSKYLGMMTLADLAYNHEMASKSNDVEYVNDHYDELMCEVNRMLEVIKQYLGR